MDKIETYSISHWSYSSIMLFLSNRYAFRKRYILKIYDNKTNPPAVVGQGGHKALEVYYNGGSIDESITAGLGSIERTQDSWIDYGKTGSREKIIKEYTQAINFYFEENPNYRDGDGYEILGVEKTITQFIEVDGVKGALPLKGKFDLILRHNKTGKIFVVDHKFSGYHTNWDEENARRIMQAIAAKKLVEKEYGEIPEKMIYDEVKKSKSKDGTAQRQPYDIVYHKHAGYEIMFNNIYNQVTYEIAKPDCVYLPNFDDMFTAKETLKDYQAETYKVENPVLVAHKIKHTEPVEKQFVPTMSDIVDNTHLTQEEKIRTKLLEFGIAAKMQETHTGPSVIKYTFKVSRGIRMAKLDQYAKDIALTLESDNIRVEAPIMGTSLVGVEVPNQDRYIVNWEKDLTQKGTLEIPIGIDVYGKNIVKKLDDMPHLLVAGATGSGKSIMLNVIIKSITETNTSENLKLILIDPKRVELSQFKDLPHLLTRPIFDDIKASKVLHWLVEEMEKRYSFLEQKCYRNIDDYNADVIHDKMFKIVVVVDEFGDLIMADQSENSVEKAIIRLTQKARAVGIHLILATQRPSVDVITGLIKANCSCRIAFATTSRVDSQVILDQKGAEELTGKGDLLFMDPSKHGLTRLQGYFV